MVEPESAQIPGCGDSAPIRADHLNMCKFKTPNDKGYDIFVAVIRKFMARSETLKPTVSCSHEVGSCGLMEPKDGSSRNIYIYGKAVNIANDTIHIASQHNTL